MIDLDKVRQDGAREALKAEILARPPLPMTDEHRAREIALSEERARTLRARLAGNHG